MPHLAQLVYQEYQTRLAALKVAQQQMAPPPQEQLQKEEESGKMEEGETNQLAEESEENGRKDEGSEMDTGNGENPADQEGAVAVTEGDKVDVADNKDEKEEVDEMEQGE